ncbi:MAG: 1-deoxy-D-xylulose-5-phosphate reductoisomerase [Fimbriiglobus sp.]
MRRVVVLGSTGSIGTSALDVVRARPDRVAIHALAAHSKWRELAAQCQEFRPPFALLTDSQAYAEADRNAFPSSTELLGPEAVGRVVQAAEVDIVLAAVVGAAGLMGTVAALEAGKTVALANKETLVVGGSRVTALAHERGAKLLPVDSEHSAIHQCLSGRGVAEVERVVLTASGGPFRGKILKDLEDITPAQALKHPTWQMGPKITIDSATLMNKSLEIIEAKWLFDLPTEKLDVLVHPESIIHSFVEFVDGSVLAQLSPPDMRLPIQYALTYPDRLPSPTRKLPWDKLKSLNFAPPDRETFPALELGFEVVRRGGSTGAVLNGANEGAVESFLTGKMAFLDIARCCRDILEHHDYDPNPTLDELYALDRWARTEVSRWTRS